MFTKNSHQTGNDIKQAERHILNRWYPCSNPHTTLQTSHTDFRTWPSGELWWSVGNCGQYGTSMLNLFCGQTKCKLFFNLRSKSSVKIMVYPWQNYILNTNRLSNISVGFITSDTHNKISNLKIPKVFK